MKFHSSKNYNHYESLRVFLREKLISCANPRPHPRSLTLASLIACTLLMSACEAQKPPITEVQKPPNTANASLKPAPLNLPNTAPFSEPAITGKIVDAQTKLPIQGAFVYGFYATHGGGTVAGGSKPGEPVKSFLAVTDANGVYTLDAWSTGDRQVGGTRGTKFPVIGIYKPGYDLWSDQMSTIAQYRPKSGVAGTEVEIKDSVRDWTKFPHLLVPLTKEIDRYNALDDSSRIMMIFGECGWEVYAPLLLAQHDELKDWYKRNVPFEMIDKNGYVRGTGPLPKNVQQLSLVFKTSVDRLLEKTRIESKCSDPRAVFKDKK
jgi:hypothetical protein